MRSDDAVTNAIRSSHGSERERRLLVLTYHFPPDGAVGGLRWAGFTKYLGARGWKSWVVTVAARAPQPLAGRVYVESCRARPTPNDLYRFLRERLSPARNTGAEGASSSIPSGPVTRSTGPITRLLHTLRWEGAGLLALSSHGRGWTLRSALRARSLIRTIRPDVVISSGPPHAAHVAACLATRGSGVPWLVDLRDPWAGPFPESGRTNPLIRSAVAMAAIACLERWALGRCSGVITTTREFRDALRQRYSKVPIHWLRNGVDVERLQPVTHPLFPGLAMVHLGSLYAGRDLGLLLRAFRLLLDRHPSAARDGSKLRCAGPPCPENLRRQITALDLEAHVEIRGSLPHSEAVDLLARSRLAIVPAQDQPLQVPAKVYESVGMGIRTVVIAPRGSATAREAVEIGAAVVEPDDVAEMLGLLEAVWSSPTDPAPPPSARIHYQDLAAELELLFAPLLRGRDAAAKREDLATPFKTSAG